VSTSLSGGFGGGLIGVDVGGTHTDVQLVFGDRLSRGKALTTYDDFSRGLLDAIAVAGEGLGLSLAEVLDRTEAIVNGTTVATNAVTQLRGARVGVLVTAGFRDVFRIAGGPRLAVFDDHLQLNVPDIVDRRAIVEIEGRIDAGGEEVVPLDLDGVDRAAAFLVSDLEVDAVAVCFLSSYQEPRHELIAEERILELFPDLYVSLSHRLFPVKGETRRWTTAVLNAFVHADTRRYLDTVDSRLRAEGFRGSLSFFQGLGGAISRSGAERFPLSLLGSGPAGGAVGAAALAESMGLKHVLLADMGGTSFDTGIIRDNELHIEKNVDIGRFPSGLNLVDIVSIGAGGGSIVTVSDRGVPQVGPHSAGSSPGPACYGQGGENATVTDALVTIGLIDPGNYLGGRIVLQPELAVEALRSSLADRFDWTPEEASAVVYELMVTNMANAIREVSISKGYDPRDFLFLAYGGTLPLFAWAIASTVGIDEVVIPDGSSVFCARGLLAADFVLRYDQSVNWHLVDRSQVDRVNSAGADLVRRAIDAMQAEGFDEAAVTVARRGDFQFPGQVFQLSMPLPEPLAEEDIDTLSHSFFELYERTYGQGTAWEETPPIMVNYTVEIRGRRANRFEMKPESPSPPTGRLLKGHRTIYLPLERQHAEVPVYDDARFTCGSRVTGPSIIDATDTTILVPTGVTASRDEFMNYRLQGSGV
jgi:N-methylhydantoinase A